MVDRTAVGSCHGIINAEPSDPATRVRWLKQKISQANTIKLITAKIIIRTTTDKLCNMMYI
jgi:hypothetical protein